MAINSVQIVSPRQYDFAPGNFFSIHTQNGSVIVVVITCDETVQSGN